MRRPQVVGVCCCHGELGGSPSTDNRQVRVKDLFSMKSWWMVRELRGRASLFRSRFVLRKGKSKMRKQDVVRICAETFAGRFGVRLISPSRINDFTCPSAQVDVAATIRDVAVWTSARSGTEQGKL